MSDLHSQLLALDRGIADRWKTRTSDNEKHILSAQDIDFIIKPIIDAGQDITAGQGTALMTIIRASIAADAVKSGPAMDRLKHWVNILAKANHLHSDIVTDQGFLQDIQDTLTQSAVGKIIFKSPGTGISYAPFDYVAVAKLIKDSDITVLQSKSGGLGNLATTKASYFGEFNVIVFNDASSQAKFFIIHEATHTIQDWNDVTAQIHHLEADAFIAEAVAILTVTPATPPGGEIMTPAGKAAQMVIDKKATGKDWMNAYNAVVAAVARIYKLHNVRKSGVKKGEGKTEITRFKSLVLAEMSEAMGRATERNYPQRPR